MKQARLYLFGVCFLLSSFFVMTDRVHAGEVNSAESQVISAASGTFTYEGATYRAYPEYINQLRDYFSRDDVDVSQSEVPGLISDMNSSVKEGIDSGYLYLVSPAPDTKTEDDKNNSKETTEEQHTKQVYKIEESIKDNKMFYHTDNEAVTSVDMVIKNTGYNISAMSVIGIGLCLLLLTGVALSVRYHLFAPGDES
ncbi:MAG: hypothetical protein J6D02_12795 [Lachnospira sp.]|nr:hypothetical protein [Lachnospira sp.]